MADAFAAPHTVAKKVLGAFRRVRLAPGLATISAGVIPVQHHQSEVITAVEASRGKKERKKKRRGEGGPTKICMLAFIDRLGGSIVTGLNGTNEDRGTFMLRGWSGMHRAT